MIGYFAPAKIKGWPKSGLTLVIVNLLAKHFQSQPLLLGCGQFITRDGKRL